MSYTEQINLFLFNTRIILIKLLNNFLLLAIMSKLSSSSVSLTQLCSRVQR